MSVIDSTNDARKPGVGDRRKLTLLPSSPPLVKTCEQGSIIHCVIISLIKSAVAVSNSSLLLIGRYENGHEIRNIVTNECISKQNLLSLVDPPGDFLKGKWLLPIGHQSFHQLS